MKLPLEYVAQSLGASPGGLSGEASGWSIDSRTLHPGDAFFAIAGEVHDGHAFVDDVLARGAAAVVVHKDGIAGDPRIIRVDDTLLALQNLAERSRDRWGGTVVAVTGSAGKTSTKEIIAAMLETTGVIGRTAGNFNNHIGLPLSILRIPDEAKLAVLELGMNHAGEIRALSAMAKPQIGVVTNVGYAHVENFEDGVDGVALAKRELVESLPDSNGVAVLNIDDHRVRQFGKVQSGRTVYYGFSSEADVSASNTELHDSGVRFEVSGLRYESPLLGRHAVRNILAGIAVSRALGLDESRLPEVVRSLRPGKMRGEQINHQGIRIINDSYNSNPDALQAMLEVLRDIPARRHIAVLGEMLELGRWSESLHREAGAFATRCGISVLAGIRGVARALVQGAIDAGLQKDAAYFFDEPSDAGNWLRNIARSGDAILFKGSRGTHVERALESFLA
ncbi:MAG: UDP-N-acetylmuramoyl-tripeptide--D-alanyl-D-alanine ligase [Bryobacteraceae bacterium]|nr:UDP-N-acetylmuramoyl-tripeptide--D-alanyl-D-alanine ligase [Bryobacteraceae bacterium]